MSIADTLRELLRRDERTLTEIASAAGVTPEFLSMVRDGKRRLSLERVIPLADALNANSGELLAVWVKEQDPRAFEVLRGYLKSDRSPAVQSDPLSAMIARLDADAKRTVIHLVELLAKRRPR